MKFGDHRPHGQELHSPLHLPLHCPLLTLCDAPSSSMERAAASQSLLILLTQQSSYLTLFMAEEPLLSTFCQGSYSISFIILIALYEPLSSCISFERKGKNCTVLKIRVHSGMCSKDILYLLTPQIQIASLTSSEYYRSWTCL